MERSGKVIIFDSEDEARIWIDAIKNAIMQRNISCLADKIKTLKAIHNTKK